MYIFLGVFQPMYECDVTSSEVLLIPFRSRYLKSAGVFSIFFGVLWKQIVKNSEPSPNW